MIKDSKINLILMADDDSDDRLLAEDALKESGCDLEIRFVEDGSELLDYLHQRNEYAEPASAPLPGLIILDLNMPRVDGREALREIKSDPRLKRIPVVVLTTSKSDTDITTMYNLGANSFITKPAAFDTLVSLMKSLVDYWFNVVLKANTI